MKKVIVLGRGVVGASVAWRLAQAGYQVTVVFSERQNCASFAAHGVLCAQGHIKPRVSLFSEKIKAIEDFPLLLQELEQLSGDKIRSYWSGVREIFFSEKERIKFLEEKYQRGFLGAFKLEPQQECQTGVIKPHGSSLLYPQAGWFCARDFMTSLYSAQKKLGVKFLEAHALSFKEHNQKVILRLQGQPSLSADYLVLASGAGSQELLDMSGFNYQGLRYYYGETLLAKTKFKSYGAWSYGGLRLARHGHDLFVGSSNQRLRNPSDIVEETLWQELQSRSQSVLQSSFTNRVKLSGIRVANLKRDPIFLPLKKNIIFLSGFHKSGFLLADLYAKKLCSFWKR